jgi:2-phosphoglycerate kinase
MAKSGDKKHDWNGDSEPDRTLVEDGANRRPYMRGIMVHSLMARGIAFKEAYQTADQVRERIRGRSVVPKEELAKAVLEILGPRSDRAEPAVPAGDEITITGRGRGLPFSKGILSQSLLAAAIDPHDAFEVAREIERALVSRREREVDRRELRELAYQVLGRRIGAEAARRYLIWRKYQDPERPVMILLGGAAGVGKTSLALEVAHRLGIGRVLSTDSIRQIMRLMLSPAIAPAIHGSSYDAHRLLSSVERDGVEQVIGGFREQAATVSVGIRASLERAVNENASLVMDGVSLVPGLIDLEPFSKIADVIFLVVGTLDEESFSNRFEARATETKYRPPHRYLENLDSILQIQDHFLELAERYEVPIVDNISFDRSVLLIIRHVTDTLTQRHGFNPEDLL